MKLASDDMDGDGVLDLVSSDVGDNKIFVALNKGDGTFLPAAQRSYPIAVQPIIYAVADLNRDGLPDIVTSTSSGAKLVVLVNK